MDNFSDTAMVLAAGLGTRMRPLTLAKPKPLHEVGGRTMLDLSLDKLKSVGIKRAVVNVCYLADNIVSHLSSRHDMEIIISRETELLDTGGGIKNALKWFGGKPFFALSADLPWTDEGEPSLPLLAKFWDAAKMDAALLLMPTKKARGFSSNGDFMLEESGKAWRKNSAEPRPYVWISTQILKPHLFDEVGEKVFSNNKIFDKAEAQGKLYGMVHKGACYHVGTPQDLIEANRLLASGEGWRVAE